MTIRIVTDSTSDLPADLAAEYGIQVVPCYINIGCESYLDAVGLSRAEFYQRLPDYNPLPTTSAPGIGKFVEIYEQLAGEGATDIISIHVHAKFSNLCNAAQLAANTLQHIKVTVVDSMSVSMGIGFIALAGARAARAGASFGEVMAHVRNTIERTHLFAVLDTLEYLRRSGRVNRLMAGLGNLLQVKPVLTLYQGRLSIEPVRTYRNSFERLAGLLASVSPLQALTLAHAHAPDRLEALRQQIQHLFPPGLATPVVEVTPIIGTHIGPGAVGFLCVSEK
jgi:DegV family protein with EDD domain